MKQLITVLLILLTLTGCSNVKDIVEDVVERAEENVFLFTETTDILGTWDVDTGYDISAQFDPDYSASGEMYFEIVEANEEFSYEMIPEDLKGNYYSSSSNVLMWMSIYRQESKETDGIGLKEMWYLLAKEDDDGFPILYDSLLVLDLYDFKGETESEITFSNNSHSQWDMDIKYDLFGPEYDLKKYATYKQ